MAHDDDAADVIAEAVEIGHTASISGPSSTRATTRRGSRHPFPPAFTTICSRSPVVIRAAVAAHHVLVPRHSIRRPPTSLLEAWYRIDRLGSANGIRGEAVRIDRDLSTASDSR